MEKLVYFLLLFLLSRRSDGSATAYTPVDVLLFLLGWFQDLDTKILDVFKTKKKRGKKKLTWNEQSRLSSTLIIAPALSNSPQ
jgi:hypothetical protein